MLSNLSGDIVIDRIELFKPLIFVRTSNSWFLIVIVLIEFEFDDLIFRGIVLIQSLIESQKFKDSTLINELLLLLLLFECQMDEEIENKVILLISLRKNLILSVSSDVLSFRSKGRWSMSMISCRSRSLRCAVLLMIWLIWEEMVFIVDLMMDGSGMNWFDRESLLYSSFMIGSVMKLIDRFCDAMMMANSFGNGYRICLCCAFSGLLLLLFENRMDWDFCEGWIELDVSSLFL